MSKHKDEADHDHHDRGSAKKLRMVSVINLTGFVAELVGGLAFGSIALLSDAFHMLFDGTAYILAFISSHIAETREEGSRWNFGFHRLETMAAFFNGALLLPMAGYIIWESYQRFLNPSEIGIVPTLVIGTGGLLVNLASVYYLEGGEMSLNEKGAFYHLLGDAGGSLAVIISTLIIHFTGFLSVDPITAVLISGLIVWSALKVLRGSTRILLQESPVDNEEIRKKILALDNVHGVKSMRIWNLCSQITIASLHICDQSNTTEESDKLRRRIRELLYDAGVDHSTIEMERHDGEKCNHTIEH